MRVLIRATNWVGDAVMSLPAVRAVAGAFPGADIAVLARPWVADLYARETAISRVIPYAPSNISEKLREGWKLRDEHFDWAILFQNAFEAAMVARVADIPRRIGYSRDGRGWLLTEAIAVPKEGEIPAHERFYYLELLRRAKLIPVLPVESEPIRLEGIPEAAAAGRELFDSRGVAMPVVGVNPGAAYGHAKRWLPERFAEAASRVASELGAEVALFGSEGERSLCEQVARMATRPVHNFAGRTTLREFIDMTAACRVVLTNDSGAMHIASALDVPTVTVFGATNDLTTGPTGAKARVIREPVACSPCMLRECPIDHRCMTRVSAERVAEAALQLVK